MQSNVNDRTAARGFKSKFGIVEFYGTRIAIVDVRSEENKAALISPRLIET